MYCTRCIVKDVLYIFILLFVHTSSELAMTSDLLSEGSHIHMFSVIFVISMILMNVDNLHIETLTDSETCSLQVILRFEKHSLTARRRFLKTFQCFYGRKLVYSNLGFYKTSVCVCVCVRVCVCVCACASVCVCLRPSTVKASSVWNIWDCQGTDQRCCVENVRFLCRVPSALLWNAEPNLSASRFILFVH